MDTERVSPGSGIAFSGGDLWHADADKIKVIKDACIEFANLLVPIKNLCSLARLVIRVTFFFCRSKSRVGRELACHVRSRGTCPVSSHRLGVDRPGAATVPNTTRVMTSTTQSFSTVA
jgi:hypothetical protein